MPLPENKTGEPTIIDVGARGDGRFFNAIIAR